MVYARHLIALMTESHAHTLSVLCGNQHACLKILVAKARRRSTHERCTLYIYILQMTVVEVAPVTTAARTNLM